MVTEVGSLVAPSLRTATTEIMCAPVPAAGQLLVGSCGDGDPRTEFPPDLDGSRTNPTGTRVNQHGFTSVHRPFQAEIGVSRQPDFRNSGSSYIRPAVGQRDQQPLGQNGLLGIAPPRRQGADAVSRHPGFDVPANRLNLTGEF
jgi:hypothetical protein